MRGKKTLSNEEIIEIVNYMIDNKVSGCDMAKKHEIPSSTFFGSINRRLAKIDEELYEKYKEYAKENKDSKKRFMINRGKLFSDEKLVEVMNYMLDNEMSASEIARKYKVPSSTFFGFLKRNLERVDEKLYKRYKEYSEHAKKNVDPMKSAKAKTMKFNEEIHKSMEDRLREIGWIQSTDEEDM